MIHFVTLLVGLVTGVQTVEVAVGPAVARVELVLDGRVVAEREGEPWLLRANLGRRPRPGILEAVAYDEAGRELGRDRQWVNVPGRELEVAIVPERNDHGRVTAARVTWHGLAEPRRVRVEIDGDAVPVEYPFRIDLSGYAPDQVHLLTVEVDFHGGPEIRRELAFGKGFSATFATGLTAVAVRVLDRDRLPEPAGMAGWFTVRGEPVAVAAVDRGPGELIIVRHPGAEERLQVLVDEVRRASRRERRRRGEAFDSVGDGVEVRVMLPEPTVAGATGGRAGLMFPVSEKPRSGSDGVLRIASGPRSGLMMTADMRLANAVALAGMQAAARDRPRAVLLLLGDARDDRSFLTEAAATGLLEALTVPLEVWDLSSSGAAQAGWEVDRRVEDMADLRRSARRLQAVLTDQRIVWLAGHHRPQDVGLSELAEGVEIAR